MQDNLIKESQKAKDKEIRSFCKINDDNITNLKLGTYHKNSVQVSVMEGTLTRSKERCSHCGRGQVVYGEISIIKNRTKVSEVVLDDSLNTKTILKLRKQRYHCRSCDSHFTAETKLVKRICFISTPLTFTVQKALQSNMAAKK